MSTAAAPARSTTAVRSDPAAQAYLLLRVVFVLAPIVGISLGAILLGESISLPIVAGAGLVIGGVWIGALRRG